MTDVRAIRQAVADAAATVTAPYRLAASGYVPGAVDPPYAYPAETDGTYHDDTDGSGMVVVTLRILTSRAEDRSGQELLDAYLASEGPSSVPAAIEAAVPGSTATGFSGYRLYEVGGVDYFGAEVTFEVLT